MTRAEMRAQLNSLAGLDLTDPEANTLLDEGYAELCTRSEWLRVNYTGSTVAGQSNYALPEGLYRLLAVKLDGYPAARADDEFVARLQTGTLTQGGWSGSSIYYLSSDSSGNDTLTFYPAPGDAQSLLLSYVALPDPLEDDDVPRVPLPFHRAIINYAQAIAYGSLEDDLDSRSVLISEFERKVDELRRLRYSRAGRGIQLYTSGVNY